MVSQRMLDMMAFVADHCEDRTHPDGCMAVTGVADTPDDICWVVLVNLCPHDHPKTNAELTQQYAENGWVNVDGD